MVSFLLYLALVGAPVSATLRLGHNMELPLPPPLSDDDHGEPHLLKRSSGSGFFDQYIDHKDHSLGTFKQKYWYNDQYYKGPGSPVVFFTPGEAEAAAYTSYLTNRTLPGQIAQAIGGASIMLEHRYWGESSPFDNLTTANLQYLDLANSISDTTHFARTVKLPFDTNGSSNAPGAPWVMSGGSYSGALAGWVESVEPGTFWAYHASSAVVEAVGDFWQYFHPVIEGMPKNCSSDLFKVIDHVDRILQTGSADEKSALKKGFGLEVLEHDDDFASAIQNGPWLWQSHDFSSGYSGFYKFCDYIENALPASNTTASAPNNTVSASTTISAVPGAHGVGLEKALAGYQKWAKDIYVPTACDSFGYYPEGDLACLNSYNFSNPLFRDQKVNNTINRQWNWFLCNEPFKYWQNGAPKGQDTIVSRLVNNEYWERQCALFFPPEPRPDGGNYTYGIALGEDVTDVNKRTGGWLHTNTTRLLWVNGEFDPWRDATVSSVFRPGGPLESTEQAPVLLIPGGIHCSDLLARNGDVNEGVRKIQEEAVQIVKKWVDEFPKTI